MTEVTEEEKEGAMPRNKLIHEKAPQHITYPLQVQYCTKNLPNMKGQSIQL